MSASARCIQLHRESVPGRPALDTAVSRALLEEAGREARESLRLYRPDDVVAFGPVDRTKPGFEKAVAAAREAGFEATLRLAGGRAAVFHRETLAFAWSIPSREPRAEVAARFRETAEILAETLASLGVDARIGEVPGEYCPGNYSINAAGRRKLVGTGQRLVKEAAYVGGVIVVRDSVRVREALLPVYEALGVGWDPATAGSIEDEIGTVTCERVADAVVDAFRRRHRVVEAPLEPRILERAAHFEADHRPD